MSRMNVALVVLIAAGGLALVFAIKQVQREPQVEIKAATILPAISKPGSGERGSAAVATAKAEAEAEGVAATLAGSSPLAPESGDGLPAFDIARVEPTGEAVIAGRAAPGATVELLRDGELHDSAIADQSGNFTMVPPRLPPGAYHLTLRSKQPSGKQATSKQNVAVEIGSTTNRRPIVALTAPDKPATVLSPPQPATGMVVVDTIEIEPDGKLHVTGRASPAATVKLYLNDSFVASVTAGADRRFAVSINGGILPGSYRVRLDAQAANSRTVSASAEAPFSVPDTIAPAPASSRGADVSGSQSPATVISAGLPDGSSRSVVVVPKITTTTVSRGDSLWRISRLTYGAGQRYPAIYKANREQIRNPSLIYPGQIFVLPAR